MPLKMILSVSIVLTTFLATWAVGDQVLKFEQTTAVELKSGIAKDGPASAFVVDVSSCTHFNENECTRFYRSPDNRYALAEVCTPTKSHPPGLYLIYPDRHIDRMPWFDPSFNQWSCTEGCVEPDECYYTAPAPLKTGRLQELTYFYRINLQHGHFHLRLEPAGKWKILDQERTDEPS